MYFPSHIPNKGQW